MFNSLEVKEPPISLVALRTELQKPENRDIVEASMQGESFEACIGIIAAKLGIMLDGDYDGAALCKLLVKKLKTRRR